MWREIDTEMLYRITRYNEAKKNGTLDRDYPVIGSIHTTS